METITEAVGRVFGGRYRVGGLLASGGSAVVWRGHDQRLDRPVAIKELSGPWLADPTALARFDREARTAARLSHPNVVAVFDVGMHDGRPYLVMELVEGATVAQLLRHGPLSVEDTVAIVAQACDGLAAAHAAGIIHRDVKPANLIVTAAGRVKVCDFGIARARLRAGDASLTGPMFAMGTSQYMAPEQAYGERIDSRADLYSLGCTMYAMLTGAPPFSGQPLDVLRKHLHEPPVPLRRHRADVPPQLAQLVEQLLAKHPDARPNDAAEVRSRLVAGRPTLAGDACPPRTARPDEKPRSRRQRRGLAMAAAVLILGGVLVAWLGFGQSAPRVTVLDPPSSQSAPSATSPEPTFPPQRPAMAPADDETPGGPAMSTPSPSSAARRSADPIAALRLSIQLQVDSESLAPEEASLLLEDVDEVAAAVAAGDVSGAADKVTSLQERLVDLSADGALTSDAYDTLESGVTSLASLLS